MATQVSANERRLAKLLYDYRDSHGTVRPAEHATYARFDVELAAFLSKRGVMKLTRNEREWVEQDRRLRRGVR